VKELQKACKKHDAKTKNLTERTSQLTEELEKAKTKLAVYEEHGKQSDLDDLSTARNEGLEEKVKELEKENSILKMQNKSELNNKVVQLENKLDDAHRGADKLKTQLDISEKRLVKLETENEGLKNELDQMRSSDFEKNEVYREVAKV